jgi:hypothetical protein
VKHQAAVAVSPLDVELIREYKDCYKKQTISLERDVANIFLSSNFLRDESLWIVQPDTYLDRYLANTLEEIKNYCDMRGADFSKASAIFELLKDCVG